MDVSRETDEQLEQYVSLLLQWNRRINLIGPADDVDVRRRHLEDCIQLAELVEEVTSPIVDLGSGAGLPGLVVAMLRPRSRVICVESDGRKAAFLREAIRTLGLNAEVRAKRIELLEPLDAPVVLARALAPLPSLLTYVSRHLADDGIALLMKGRRWQEELEIARDTWHFSVEAASSRTEPQAAILRIGGLRRV